jgi:hypothetical protein
VSLPGGPLFVYAFVLSYLQLHFIRVDFFKLCLLINAIGARGLRAIREGEEERTVELRTALSEINALKEQLETENIYFRNESGS